MTKNLLKFTDNEEIRKLNHDQVDLPRRAIKEIIQLRKTKAYVESQKAKGINLTICATCHRIVRPRHTCWLTNWTIQDKKQFIKQTVITQEGAGPIKLQQKKFDDITLVGNNYIEDTDMPPEPGG